MNKNILAIAFAALFLIGFAAGASTYTYHEADLDKNWKMDPADLTNALTLYKEGELNSLQLSRIITFYNSDGYRVNASTTDGFAPIQLPSGKGALEIRVQGSAGTYLNDATVRIENGSGNVYTGTSSDYGAAYFELSPGTCNYAVKGPSGESATGAITVSAGTVKRISVSLAQEYSSLKLTVKDAEDNSAIANAWASLSGRADFTSASGIVQFSKMTPGTYTVTIIKNGYNTFSHSYTLTTGDSISETVYLEKISQNNAPSISGLPDKSIVENSGSQYRIIDLYGYASDDSDSDSELVFSVTRQSNSSLINCYIESDRYVSCSAPRGNSTGTNNVTVRVRDHEGLTAEDTFAITVYSNGNDNGSCSDVRIDVYTVTMDEDDYQTKYFNVYNYSDSTFRVTNVRVSESSNYASARIIDKPSRIYKRNSARIGVEFESYGVSGDRSITIELEIEGYFEGGDNCSGSDIRETFTLRIDDTDNGNNDNGMCGDLRVVTKTIFMDESDTETISIEVENNSYRDFEITNIDAKEDSDYLTVRDTDYPDYIYEDDTGTIKLELKSSSVTSDREAMITLEIEGRFENGERCTNSDIKKVFRVWINNSGASSSACNALTLTASDITVPENSRKTATITLENDYSRDFRIDTIKANETSMYFSTRVINEPSIIKANDDGQIKVEIDASAVSRDQSGNVDVTISGRFTDGKYCSSSAVKENFKVIVDDSGSSNNDGTSDSTGLQIAFSNSFLSLKENETEIVRATLLNNTGKSQCFALSTGNGAVYSASLSSSSICLANNESETVSISIYGQSNGTGNVQFKAEYDGVSKSKFVTIEVTGQAPPSARPEITVEDLPETLSEDTLIELVNDGERLENVVISLENLSDGLEARSVVKEVWLKGEKAVIDLTITDPDFEGVVEANLRITSNTGTRNIPVNFEVKHEEAPLAGLVPLATTIGMALGLIILLVLVVAGILSIISKK